jgi:O-antigen/teichoic acid export membrane protein
VTFQESSLQAEQGDDDGVLRAGVRAVVSTVGARGVILLSGLVSAVIVTRALGPVGRGQYFAVVTLATLLAQVSNLGLASSNTYLAAREPELAWPLTVNSCWLAGSVCLILLGSVWLAGEPIAHRLALPRVLLWALPLFAPAVLLFTLAGSVLTAQQRFSALNAWQSVNAALGVLVAAVLAAAGAGAGGFVAGLAASSLLVAGVTAARIYDPRSRSVWPRLDLLRRGGRYSSAAFIALCLAFVNQRLGVFFLSREGNLAETGYFSLAAQWHDVLIVLPSAISTVLFPALIRRQAGAWALTRQALLVSVLLTSIACLTLVIIAGPLTRVLFGAPFAPAVPVIRAVVPAVMATAAGAILSQYLVRACFRPSIVAAWLAAAVANATAAAYLVPRHGAVGAATAQSIGAGVALLALFAIVWRRRQSELRDESVPGVSR